MFAVHAGGSGGGLGGPVPLPEGGDGRRDLPLQLQIDSKMVIIQIFMFVHIFLIKFCGPLTS